MIQEVDQDHVVAVLGAMFAPGEVIEVRIPSVQRAGTVSGYFDDFTLVARAVGKYALRADGIYFTLNPVKRMLLARSANHLGEWVKHVTSDVDIEMRRFMLLDFDAVRPSGISSSEEELAAALERRDAVKTWLEGTGKFPAGMTALSGNGGHLLYRLPDLPNTREMTDLVQACIVAVKTLFGDKLVSVDNTMFNASRLTKLYGTWARKGDNLPDRPHRLSHLDLPTVPLEPLTPDMMHWLANQVSSVPMVNSKPVFVTDGRRLDVEAYLAAGGREYRARQKGNVTWYNFKDCPVHADPDGDRYECGICQFENGAIGAKCQHDPQATWADFKAVLGDPSPYYVGRESAKIGLHPEIATIPTRLAGEGELTLDQLITYARCPMAHFLQQQAKTQAQPTGAELLQQTVRDALRDFHSNTKPTPFAAIKAVWGALLGEWKVEKVDDAYAALEQYARLRTELLLPFMRGEILRSDGSPYDEPRKTRIFQNAAQARGLLQLQEKVDKKIPHPPVSLRSSGPLADVFADTLEIILQYQEPEADEFTGVQVPFSVGLPGGQTLAGWADLVARVQERGEPGVAAIVHDFARQCAPWDILRHDLRVVALLNAGDDFWLGETQRTVKVHHLRSGEIVSVFGCSSPAWGRALLALAARAMVFPGIPRMAIAPGQCADCRYWETCSSSEGWNVLTDQSIE